MTLLVQAGAVHTPQKDTAVFSELLDDSAFIPSCEHALKKRGHILSFNFSKFQVLAATL